MRKNALEFKVLFVFINPASGILAVEFEKGKLEMGMASFVRKWWRWAVGIEGC